MEWIIFIILIFVGATCIYSASEHEEKTGEERIGLKIIGYLCFVILAIWFLTTLFSY